MIDKETLEKLVELGAKATERPWKCWNGWGPHTDGLMRCERIGPADSGLSGIMPSAPERCPDLCAKTEDFEYLAASANAAVDLARECVANRARIERLEAEVNAWRERYQKEHGGAPLLEAPR